MRKLLIGVAGATALLVAGMLAWNAEALTGATTSHPRTNFSLIERTACRGVGGTCQMGQHKFKGECVPCKLPPTCNGCPCWTKVGNRWVQIC